MLIVDEFTGRLMPGRRFSDGLHQALEAKEKVRVGEETQTLATITLQNYFRLYKKLAGMTGTAETEAAEFFEIYKLDVVVIPTNEPVRRVDYDDLIYRTRREKYNADHRRDRGPARGRAPGAGRHGLGRGVGDAEPACSSAAGSTTQVLNAKYHQARRRSSPTPGGRGR